MGVKYNTQHDIDRSKKSWANTWKQLFTFEDPREQRAVKSIRRRHAAKEAAGRHVAFEKAKEKLQPPQGALPVPSTPWMGEGGQPTTDPLAWAMLPREYQLEITEENEYQRLTAERVRKQADTPFKDLTPEEHRKQANEANAAAMEGINASIAELTARTQKPVEKYVRETPHLAMIDGTIPGGVRVVAAKNHVYKFLTDEKYRKKIWALPEDEKSASEAGRNIPWSKFTIPDLSNQLALDRHENIEWWQKALPVVARLYSSDEKRELYELGEKAANETLNSEETWKLGYHLARAQLAQEAGLSEQAAEQIRDVAVYFAELSLVFPVASKAGGASKTALARVLGGTTPSVTTRVGAGLVGELTAAGVSTALSPQHILDNFWSDVPGLELRYDEENKLRAYMSKDARDMGRKILDSIASTYVTHLTERMGFKAMGATGKLIKAPGALAASKIAKKYPWTRGLPAKMAENVGLMSIANRAQSLGKRVGESKVGSLLGFTNKALKGGGFHGFIPEMAEEWADAFLQQYVNPEHFISTEQENLWTMTEDWVAGTKVENSEGQLVPKVTAGDISDQVLPMAIAFMAFGVGTKVGGKAMRTLGKEPPAPEPTALDLEPPEWRELLTQDGRRRSDALIGSVRDRMQEAIDKGPGAIGEALKQVRGILDLATEEAQNPSDQNISRKTFESIQWPGIGKTLYELMPKKEDRKGFLDGIRDGGPAIEETLQSLDREVKEKEREQVHISQITENLRQRMSAAGVDVDQISAEEMQDMAREVDRYSGRDEETYAGAFNAVIQKKLGEQEAFEAAQMEVGVPQEVDPEAGISTEMEPAPAEVTPTEVVSEVVVEEQPPAEPPPLPDVVEQQPAAEAPTISANDSVINLLRGLAETEKTGKRFAYAAAAETIENLDVDVQDVKDLEDLPKIGPGTAKRIRDHLETLKPEVTTETEEPFKLEPDKPKIRGRKRETLPERQPDLFPGRGDLPGQLDLLEDQPQEIEDVTVEPPPIPKAPDVPVKEELSEDAGVMLRSFGTDRYGPPISREDAFSVADEAELNEIAEEALTVTRKHKRREGFLIRAKAMLRKRLGRTPEERAVLRQIESLQKTWAGFKPTKAQRKKMVSLRKQLNELRQKRGDVVEEEVAEEAPAAPEAAVEKAKRGEPKPTLKLTKMEKEILGDRLGLPDAIYDAIEAEEKGWTLDQVSDIAKEFLAGNYTAALESELGREILFDAHASSPYVGAAEDVTAPSDFGKDPAKYGLMSRQKYQAIQRAYDKLGEKLEGFLGKEEVPTAAPKEPSAPGRGAAGVVTGEGIPEDLKPVVAMAGVFGTGAINVKKGPIAKFFHRSTEGLGSPPTVEPRWVDRLLRGFEDVDRKPFAKEAFDAIWDSPDHFFRDYHAALQKLRSMEFGEGGHRSEDDQAITEAMKASKVFTVSDSQRTSGTRHLATLESVLKISRIDKSYKKAYIFKDAYEKALAKPLPDAPKAAEDVLAAENIDDKSDAPSGKEIPPGTDSSAQAKSPKVKTQEEIDKEIKDYDKAYEKALEERPYETVLAEGKRVNESRLVNHIVNYYQPDLKGSELKDFRAKVLAMVNDAHEQLNRRRTIVLKEFPALQGIKTDEGWKKLRARAKRLADTGKRRVYDQDLRKHVVKATDYGSLGLDAIAESVRSNPELRALLSEVVGDTSNEESAVYDLLTAVVPYVKKISPEVEQAVLDGLDHPVFGTPPSWAPQPRAYKYRGEDLIGDTVAGEPEVMGVEEGEVVPEIIVGKVVSQDMNTVVVESDGVEWEIPRERLHTYYGEDGEELDFEGEAGGFVSVQFAFGPALLGPVLEAANRLSNWMEDTTSGTHFLDKMQDMARVGGLFGKDFYNEMIKAESSVTKETERMLRNIQDLNDAILRSPWKKSLPITTKALPSLALYKPIEAINKKQRNALNKALETRVEKLTKEYAKEIGLPEELIAPVKAVREQLNGLSNQIDKMLPELMKDPDFVKNYDKDDLVRIFATNKGVHLHRAYRADDNKKWGNTVRRKNPELIDQLRAALVGGLRAELIEARMGDLVKKKWAELGRESGSEVNKALKQLKKLKEVKNKASQQGQKMMWEGPTEKDLMEKITELQRPIIEAAQKAATRRVDQDIKAGKSVTEEQIEGWIDSYLNGSRVSARVRKTLGKSDMRMFLTRTLGEKQHHLLMRKILGEYHEPQIRAMRTAEQLASFIASRELGRKLAREGLRKGWFIKPAPEGPEGKVLPTETRRRGGKYPRHFDVTLPTGPEWGPLSGLRTTKAMKEAMERFFGGGFDGSAERPVMMSVYRSYMTMVLLAKASKTIFTWSTQSMNAMSNVMIGLVHGDFYRPKKIWEAFMVGWSGVERGEPFLLRRARAKALQAKAPKDKEKWEKKVVELRNDFVERRREVFLDRVGRGVYFDTPSRELDYIIQEAFNADANMLAYSPGTFEADMGKFGRGVENIKRGLKKYWNVHAVGYRFGDDAFKGVADSAIIEMLEEAYPPEDPRWEGFSSADRMDEIKKEAALRVRDRYPTSTMAPEAINLLRKWPTHATFPTWFSEFVRTQYLEMFHKDGWVRKDWRSGNSRLRRHAMATWMRWTFFNTVANSVGGFLLKAGLGLLNFDVVDDDEEEEILRVGAYPWDRFKDLVFFKRIEDGEAQYNYANLSRVNPYSRVLNAVKVLGGDDSAAEKVFHASDVAAGELISTDMVVGMIMDLIYNTKSSGGDVFNPESPRWGEQALRHIWRVFQPGEWEMARRLGGFSPWEVPLLQHSGLGDYFRGWGKPDVRGREYDVKTELLAIIAPRITRMRPETTVAVGLSITADKLSNMRKDLYKSGTGEGWRTLDDFKGSLKHADIRYRMHLDSVADLVRFGHQTGMTRGEIRDVLSKRLGSVGHRKADVNKIIGRALRNEEVYIPLRLTSSMKVAIRASKDGPEKMRYYDSGAWRKKKATISGKIRK